MVENLFFFFSYQEISQRSQLKKLRNTGNSMKKWWFRPKSEVMESTRVWLCKAAQDSVSS